jgi:hypothetical protein
MEEKAARAYDLAALKYWGPSTHINFPVMIFTFFYFFYFLFQFYRGEGGLFCISCTEIQFFFCFFIAGKLSK